MVVEVGLGGTWDCTNVVKGDVAVLTNVSFDHTDVLGPTLEGIAADKAGIIEPGSRVVRGRDGPGPGRHRRPAGPRRSVRPRSGWPGGTSAARSNRVAVGGRLVTLWTPGGPLRGRPGPAARRPPGRQRRRGHWPRSRRSSASRCPSRWWRRGWPRCGCPGRLEVLGRRPLLLVDGAHNAAGMAALGDALQRGVRGGRHVGRGRRHAVGSRPVGDVGAARLASASQRSSRASPTRHAPCRSPRSAKPGAALGLAVYEEPDVREALARGAWHGRCGRARRGRRIALRRRRGARRRAGIRRALGGSRSLT